MKKRKIKFTDKKHSRNGILSTILGFFVACAGAWYGVLGRREEDSYRLFPDLGIGINGLLLVGFVMIYIMGW